MEIYASMAFQLVLLYYTLEECIFQLFFPPRFNKYML